MQKSTAQIHSKIKGGERKEEVFRRLWASSDVDDARTRGATQKWVTD